MTDNQPARPSKPCGRCSGSMVEPSIRFATADGWVEFCEVCVRIVCQNEYGAMKERGGPPIACRRCNTMMIPKSAVNLSELPAFASAFPGIDTLNGLCQECFERLWPGIEMACFFINEQLKANRSEP